MRQIQNIADIELTKMTSRPVQVIHSATHPGRVIFLAASLSHGDWQHMADVQWRVAVGLTERKHLLLTSSADWQRRVFNTSQSRLHRGKMTGMLENVIAELWRSCPVRPSSSIASTTKVFVCFVVFFSRYYVSGWRAGAVVNEFVSIDEVNQRRARSVRRWVTVFRRANHLGM